MKHTHISTQDYRDCMARFAGAVHLVATDGKAGRRGVTVSAVTSVSDNPPTLLFCLNRNRKENHWFEKNGVFSLNTLCADQINLARAFAGEEHRSMDERFALAKWDKLVTGSPVLMDSRMSLDCIVRDAQTIATHTVVFGEVVAYRKSDQNASLPPALCYIDRHYKSL